jgi:hypothetical protein
VNLQDQATRPFDIRINEIVSTDYNLSNNATIDSYDINLTSTVGLSVGDSLAILEQNGIPHIYFGEIQSILSNTVTMDSPIPYKFESGVASVFEFNDDLNVDGSVNAQVFSVVNVFEVPVDIVRFMFYCTSGTEMDDGRFCEIESPALSRGIVLRKKLVDGSYINYWTIKNNGDWGELAFDTSYTDKGKQPDEIYSFSSRLTYGGQSKHGVVIRLEPGEEIQLLVQDDLTEIPSMHLMVEGHFTQP